jgi:DNA-binding Lrp family transcriptional regulator
LLRDDIDRAIVAHLRKNARASFAQIGAQVGLSAPAVKRRVDRLEAAGVILGYRAVVDPAVDGAGIEAFVELSCRHTTLPKDVAEIVADRPEVVSACTVTGDADAILHLRAKDMSELEDAIAAIRADPRTDRTRSVVVLTRLFGD